MLRVQSAAEGSRQTAADPVTLVTRKSRELGREWIWQS